MYIIPYTKNKTMTIHSMSLRIQFERNLRIFVHDSTIFLNEFHTYT